MLKPIQAPTICPRFLPEFIMIIFVLFSLLFTNSAFATFELQATTNSSYKYPVTTLLDSMTNNSALNGSSTITGSPLSITKELRNLNETIPIPGKQGHTTVITTIYSLKTRVRYRLQVTILIPESLVKKQRLL